jgi:hypothetical protein
MRIRLLVSPAIISATGRAFNRAHTPLFRVDAAVR